MLSKNTMVKALAGDAVKRLFTDVCTVYSAEKKQGADGQTVFRREVLYENLPCRISFESINYARVGGAMERTRFPRKNLIPAAEISTVVRLFYAADVDIPEGAEVVVERCGELLNYRAAGASAVYSSHREVLLQAAEKFV